jgi:hypothetical protein
MIKNKEASNVCEHQDTRSPTPRRHNPQQDTSTRHGFSNNMTFLSRRLSNRTTLRALSSSLALTVSLGGVITLLDNQVLGAVIVAAREV